MPLSRKISRFITVPPVEPRVQFLSRDVMPVRREPGVGARLYSGRSGGFGATTTNAVPITLIDARLQAGSEAELYEYFAEFRRNRSARTCAMRSLGNDNQSSDITLSLFRSTP